MSGIIPSLGGRRFLLSVMTLVSCVALVATHRIDSGAFTTVVLGTVGAFVAGTTYQHREQIRAGAQQPGSAP